MLGDEGSVGRGGLPRIGVGLGRGPDTSLRIMSANFMIIL